METGRRKIRLFRWIGLGLLIPLPLQAGTLSFSGPRMVAALPWSDGSNAGVPSQGAEKLMVDPKGIIVLATERSLDFFSRRGRLLQTFHPLDPANNFFGYSSLESLGGGKVALLARLESPLEQRNKDNFEERAQPGARLIVLDREGKKTLDKVELDRSQPHSFYVLQDNVIASIHEDGAFEVLDRLGEKASLGPSFGDYARLAFSQDRWQSHLEKLPVYKTQKGSYHDVQNHLHRYQGAMATLLGRKFVEGTGPLAERRGRIYFQVMCDIGGRFSSAVFVEDPGEKRYGLVELIDPDNELNKTRPFTLFVDAGGNLFEGVAKKEGYRIYEWKWVR